MKLVSGGCLNLVRGTVSPLAGPFNIELTGLVTIPSSEYNGITPSFDTRALLYWDPIRNSTLIFDRIECEKESSEGILLKPHLQGRHITMDSQYVNISYSVTYIIGCDDVGIIENKSFHISVWGDSTLSYPLKYPITDIFDHGYAVFTDAKDDPIQPLIERNITCYNKKITTPIPSQSNSFDKSTQVPISTSMLSTQVPTTPITTPKSDAKCMLLHSFIWIWILLVAST